MAAVISDGNYHSVGYDGLHGTVIGNRSAGRTFQGDRLMHFFGTDRYTETGTYGNLDEDVTVLRYEDIVDIRAFKQVKNIHDEIVPGVLFTFRCGAQLLVTLEDLDEVQDLAKFVRFNMNRCKGRKSPMHG